jgi:hypothetical protein
MRRLPMLNAQSRGQRLQARNDLTFVAAFSSGVAQGVMDNLAEDPYQFVRFLNQRIELRRKQSGALADAESEPGLLSLFQRDPVLGNEVVVTGCSIRFFGI